MLMRITPALLAGWAAFACRACVGLTFGLAGIAKLVDPNGFAEEIMRYQLVPWPGAVVLALWLPWLELLCGFGVFVPRLRLGALALAGFALVLFAGALGSAWARGLAIDCGCFGAALGRTSVPGAVGRDLVLLALWGWAWAHDVGPLARRSALTPEGGLA